MSGNKKNVTIKEIAKRAGVSVSTVSRVMSGKKTAIPISESTREKVLAVCNELKFLPDVNYTRLQERRSTTIGFLVPRMRPDSPHPVFFDENIGRALSELEMLLSAQGFSILVQGVDEAYEAERRHLRILRNNTVDALIIWDAFRDSETIRALAEETRPSVCIALPYDVPHNLVVPDNYQGAREMTRALIEMGHRRIAYINGGMGELVDSLREQGYRDAMGEAGLEASVAIGNYRLESGQRCAAELLGQHPDLTAIFCAGDIMAIGVLEHARAAGISVPDQLSIAGFDDLTASQHATPRISTCRLPMEEIARVAVEKLLAMIEKGIPQEPINCVVPVEIKMRESTAAPAGALNGKVGR